MKRLKEYFERRAIQKFIRTVSVELRRRYGGKVPFTIKQMQVTIDELNLEKSYTDFAIYLLCLDDDYEKYGFQCKDIKKYRGYQERYFDGPAVRVVIDIEEILLRVRLVMPSVGIVATKL